MWARVTATAGRTRQAPPAPVQRILPCITCVVVRDSLAVHQCLLFHRRRTAPLGTGAPAAGDGLQVLPHRNVAPQDQQQPVHALECNAARWAFIIERHRRGVRVRDSHWGHGTPPPPVSLVYTSWRKKLYPGWADVVGLHMYQRSTRGATQTTSRSCLLGAWRAEGRRG